MPWDIVQPAPGTTLSIAANDQGITRIHFDASQPPDCGERDPRHPLIVEAARQLTRYFAGHLRAFTLPLDLRGTAFQKRIWQLLCEIPYGRTISYKELATRAGSPNAFRAAGSANGRNPVPIVVPCHRVIESGGGLGGFGGGLDYKRRLLDLESKQAQVLL